MLKLRIVSRNSPLAIAQAEIVKQEIYELYPETAVEIIGITTAGDKILDKTLDKIGGKGLFIKELQHCLINGEADLAVHSLKDVPMSQTSEFIIPAVLKRIDVTDCFVSNAYDKLDNLPSGAVVGTSSARRIALLKHYYPLLEVKMLRGNVQTRLAKLDSGGYDGIILASAGLKRLGLEHRIRQSLDTKLFVPAIGQGALAIEIMSNRLDLMLLLAKLDDEDTCVAVETEREVGRLLGVDCGVPIGVYANISGDIINLSAMVANNERNKFIVASVSDVKHNYLNLAHSLVVELKYKGVDDLL